MRDYRGPKYLLGCRCCTFAKSNKKSKTSKKRARQKAKQEIRKELEG